MSARALGPFPAHRSEIPPAPARVDAFFVADRPRPYAAVRRCLACRAPFAVLAGGGRPPKHCHWCLRDRGRGYEDRKRRRDRSL